MPRHQASLRQKMIKKPQKITVKHYPATFKISEQTKRLDQYFENLELLIPKHVQHTYGVRKYPDVQVASHKLKTKRRNPTSRTVFQPMALKKSAQDIRSNFKRKLDEMKRQRGGVTLTSEERRAKEAKKKLETRQDKYKKKKEKRKEKKAKLAEIREKEPNKEENTVVFNMVKDKHKTENNAIDVSNRDLKGLKKKLESATKDEKSENDAWKKMEMLAKSGVEEGKKLKKQLKMSDSKYLAKQIKRVEKEKKIRKENWEERKKGVKEKKERRIEKRNENIENRRKSKVEASLRRKGIRIEDVQKSI
eukprot:augustus_masked-scaffold_34-processed-gene-2.33-mRNA-1 protein AED:1.00 eAED:1.00 QI:0/-1/0/0/-1/1/1/0/305